MNKIKQAGTAGGGFTVIAILLWLVIMPGIEALTEDVENNSKNIIQLQLNDAKFDPTKLEKKVDKIDEKMDSNQEKNDENFEEIKLILCDMSKGKHCTKNR